MWTALKKLTLGLVLIAAAAAVLLCSDLGSRRTEKRDKNRVLRVAIVQQISTPALDDGVAGAIAGLHERGYTDGGRVIFTKYNAEGDITTGNAIAKAVTNGDFDLIFSFSTVSLQTIANANRYATPPRRHVFALVSDPYAVGVGVSRENHLQHPPYMTGMGNLAPVGQAFHLARQMNPGLKRVGLVWDPSEANSVVTTNLARKVCASMGIQLIEANAENSTAISEATASVLSRRAQAIWISPDLIASHGLELIVSKAKLAAIPVFTSVPRTGQSGTLFELGADYPAIGRNAGHLAADVLDGRDPASIPVENVIPITLNVNQLALKGLRENWNIPPEIVQQADVVIDATGSHNSKKPAAAQPVNSSGAVPPSGR